MLAAGLFTVAKTRNQPKCQSVDERINKRRYMYTVENYSVIKKNEIIPSAAIWIQLEIITLSEVSQRKTMTM